MIQFVGYCKNISNSNTFLKIAEFFQNALLHCYFLNSILRNFEYLRCKEDTSSNSGVLCPQTLDFDYQLAYCVGQQRSLLLWLLSWGCLHAFETTSWEHHYLFAQGINCWQLLWYREGESCSTISYCAFVRHSLSYLPTLLFSRYVSLWVFRVTRP